MTIEQLNRIIENHRHWVARDCDGWEEMRAYLIGADLTGADLYRADLTGADLTRADLTGADLYGANLSGANLHGVNLHGAYLAGADLYGADLTGADLYGAYLTGADLYRANLYRANLTGADLHGANLSGANLSGANLHGATGIDLIPMACPDTGSFIGYKKASGYIVKLQILDDSRRCSASGRKCRCDKAKVLEIQTIDGAKADLNVVRSSYKRSFLYTVGEIVEEPEFDSDRWNECSRGIHFFINRIEAVLY